MIGRGAHVRIIRVDLVLPTESEPDGVALRSRFTDLQSILGDCVLINGTGSEEMRSPKRGCIFQQGMERSGWEIFVTNHMHI